MKKPKSFGNRIVSAFVLLSFVLLSAQVFGQNASLSGTVTDETQGVLPGATVTAVNEGTGVKATVTTNDAGVYNFAALQPGTYRVTAEMPGFQVSTKTDVRLTVGTPLRLNFEMLVSGVATEVEVSTSVQEMLLEASPTTGVVMNQETVKELPLLGNDMMQLINVMGGVVKQENTIFGADQQALAGVTAQNVNITRDGISVSDVRFASGITSPGKLNPEMIGEFKMVLSPVDAELGRGAGQIQVMTKSGSNEYHGSAVWSVLNNALDATDWNDNRLGTTRDWQNVNQYTLSLGGPIKKNKTFFFVTWDHNIVKKRTNVNGRALTPCARKGIYRYFTGYNNGNMNQLGNPSGTPIVPVVDALGNPVRPQWEPDPSKWPDEKTGREGVPYTGRLAWASVLGELTPEAQAQIAEDPINCSKYDFSFANPGIVPDSNWDRDSYPEVPGGYRKGVDSTGYIEKFTSLMPLPNYYAMGDGLNVAAFRWTRTNNGSDTVYGTGFDTPRKSITAKIDHNINDAHRLSGTLSYEETIADTSETTWPNGFGGVNDRKPITFTSSLTSTLRPTLLNEFRFGMAYSSAHNVAPLDGPNAEPLKAELQKLLPTDNFPLWSGLPFILGPGQGDFRFQPATDMGGHIVGGRNPYEDTWGSSDYRYTFGDTLTWTRGSHSFKFGGELRLTKANSDRNGAGGWGEISPSWFPDIMGGWTVNSQYAGLSSERAIRQFFYPHPEDPDAMVGLVGSDAGGSSSGTYAGVYHLLDYFAGSIGMIRQYYFVNDAFSNQWSDPTTPEGQVNNLAMNQRELALFVKDDWKVTRDLTLNLGLRYEYYGVPWMINGTTVGIAGGSLNMFGGSVGGFGTWLQNGAPYDPNNLTRYEFIGPNSPNPGRSLYNKDLNNFGPAVGFAWQLPWFGKGKTTLRGGYQVNFVPIGRLDPNAGPMAAAGNQPGMQFLDAYSGTSTQHPYMDISMLPELLPTNRHWVEGVTQTPIGVQVIPDTNFTASTSAYEPNIRTPYIQSLTMALTRQIGSNLTVDVRYIGTLSRKQIATININEANWISNGLLEAFEQVARGQESPLINQLIGPGVLIGGPAGQVSGSAQLLAYGPTRTALATGNYESVASALARANGTVSVKPGEYGGVVASSRLFPKNFIFANPQFGSALLYGNHNHANYHSMQAQVTLRPTHGLNFQATYTWGRNLGMLTTTDPLNRAADYGILGIHRSHMLQTHGKYDLPFGPNGYLFRNSSGWVRKLAEGWQVSWISSITSGVPASITTVQSMWDGSGVDLVRPDLFDTKGGHITWEHGADSGFYFGDKYVQVPDPRCLVVQGDQPSAQFPNGTGLVATCRQNLKALALASDPSVIVFQKAEPGRRGNFAPNSLTGPGRWSVDMSMGKSIEFMEGKNMEFRVDVNNIFNHPTPTGANPATPGNATYNYRDYWWSSPNFNLNSTEKFGQIRYKAGHRVFSAKVRITF